ncbi:MAG: phosphoribosyl-AMP cyclohydrolase, partial [Pseudomonadota bacterium]
MTETPEFAKRGSKEIVETGRHFQPKFDADGLIPAIVTDAAGGGVLMFAFMNAEALQATIETRRGHFYSRSRQRQWMKGEQSGNILEVQSLYTDCDQDVVWLTATVAGDGAACHTG